MDFAHLRIEDEEIYGAMEQELQRLRDHIELIASENFTSPAVMEAVGSYLTNKYAEGYPGKRYYGGCEHVDVIEEIARRRACELFGAEHANVQPHAGSQANVAVYLALCKPGDVIMGMDLNAGGSSLSAGGTLRMKRDDVVQLSLTFLGLEVGRLEFTPDGVLIVDRMNKQYVRAAYTDVSFLRQAGLDFYTLQALFWNELFVPGQRRADAAAGRFRISASGDHTLLSLTDAPGLDYSFLAQTATGCVDRVYVTPRDGQDGQFTWTYADFTAVGGKPFPTTMTCAVTGTGKDVGFTLRLSRIGNDSGWPTRTEVSDKYTRRDADEILRRLIAH